MLSTGPTPSSFEDGRWKRRKMEEKAHSVNELMNDEAVYRTASATPGLLKTAFQHTLGDISRNKYTILFPHFFMPPFKQMYLETGC